MRYRISSNIRWARFIFLVIGLISLLPFLNQSVQIFTDRNALLRGLIFPSVCGLLYYLFGSARTVEFDSENMYIIRKRNEEVIPLGSVYKIKLTMTRLSNRHFWKIGYLDNYGMQRSVRILPRYKYFDDFTNQVKKANPEVRITNWSWSFDLDQ